MGNKETFRKMEERIEKMMEDKREIEEEKQKEEHVYKNKVVFLRLSKSGEHVYAFNRDGALGKEVASLIANVKDIRAVIDDKSDWAKISIVKEKED